MSGYTISVNRFAPQNWYQHMPGGIGTRGTRGFILGSGSSLLRCSSAAPLFRWWPSWTTRERTIAVVPTPSSGPRRSSRTHFARKPHRTMLLDEHLHTHTPNLTEFGSCRAYAGASALHWMRWNILLNPRVCQSVRAPSKFIILIAGALGSCSGCSGSGTAPGSRWTMLDYISNTVRSGCTAAGTAHTNNYNKYKLSVCQSVWTENLTEQLDTECGEGWLRMIVRFHISPHSLQASPPPHSVKSWVKLSAQTNSFGYYIYLVKCGIISPLLRCAQSCTVDSAPLSGTSVAMTSSLRLWRLAA